MEIKKAKNNQPWQTVQRSLSEARQHCPLSLGGYNRPINAFLLLLGVIDLTGSNVKKIKT